MYLTDHLKSLQTQNLGLRLTCTSTARPASGWVAVSSSSDLQGLAWAVNSESYGRKSQLRQQLE